MGNLPGASEDGGADDDRERVRRRLRARPMLKSVIECTEATHTHTQVADDQPHDAPPTSRVACPGDQRPAIQIRHGER